MSSSVPSVNTTSAYHLEENYQNDSQKIATIDVCTEVTLPTYLQQTYWWAYLHPMSVRIFERQWLINLILWGNFEKLRDITLDEIGSIIQGDILQIACVYGNFTERLLKRLSESAQLAVIDVAMVQLDNLKSKVSNHKNLTLYHQDSTNLQFADNSFDSVIIFFLLHEQPSTFRVETLMQAIRVVKPTSGKIIIVDYHRPNILHPLRYVMVPVLKTLEPFAMDLWHHDLINWIPKQFLPSIKIEKHTYFGGLYQKVVLRKLL